MKIAILCSPYMGGSSTIATELGVEMAKRGHQVHFISSERPFLLNNSIKNIFFHEVYITDYPLFKYPPYDSSLIIRIAELLQEYDFDIIHAHYALPYGLCAHFARMLINHKKVKIITTIHGTEVFVLAQHHLYKDMLRYVLKTSDVVTTVSKYLKKTTNDLIGKIKHIEVIYNFVDSDIFSPSKKNMNLRQKYAQNEEKIIIHASNMRPIKRLMDVIAVFNQIQMNTPARLLLMGDGPDRQNALALCKQLNIRDKVYFLGKQLNREDFYSMADLFLLPSSFESFGLSALEAMSCGVPVMITAVGGAKELIGNERNSLLCQPEDISGMSMKAIDLLSNSKKLEKMKENARMRAESFFIKSKIIQLYEKNYEKVLSTVKK